MTGKSKSFASAINVISGAKEQAPVIASSTDEELYSERTQILLKKSTKDGIKEAAWQNRLSMNGMINKILEEYLQNH